MHLSDIPLWVFAPCWQAVRQAQRIDNGFAHDSFRHRPRSRLLVRISKFARTASGIACQIVTKKCRLQAGDNFNVLVVWDPNF